MPNVELLHQFFEAAVDRDPHRIAVSFEDEDFTYEFLEQRSNQIAHLLIERGVTPGARIGICLPRSLDTYASLLAVLKAGCCFVPLSAEFPASRIRYIAEDAELAAIITTAELARSEDETGAPSIQLDELRDTLSDLPTSPPCPEGEVCEQDLCYVIYTSGTTGQPKGVAVEHRSICNFVRCAQQVYDYRPGDRVYQGMTIAFDFSVEEIWIALAVGATLVPGPTDTRRLGDELGEFLQQQEVSIFCCVPTLLATINRDVPSLRQILVGGEACPADLVEAWSQPDRRLLNTYGPTEATVTATWCELLPGRPVTIGRPLPTYSVAILDDEGNPVPEGESGEICIGGIGVARGYLNKKKLTESKFIPDRIGLTGDPAGRLYRTGDLGRIDDSGEIVFLGRVDTQVKLNGYRIELEEIEAVLRSDPSVVNAAVFVCQLNGHAELAAYVVLRPNSTQPQWDRMNDLVAANLPNYMRPSFLDVVDTLPVMPSGKLDRNALPKPERRLARSSAEVVSPRSAMEELVHAAFSEALHGAAVSIHDDFFYDLGGDSLLAAKLVSLLRQHDETHHVGLGDLYASPSVAELAEFFQEASQPTEGEQSTNREVPRPITASSLRVWLCGAAQLGFLLLYGAVLAIPGVLALNWLYEQLLGSSSVSVLQCVGVVSASFFASLALTALMPIGLKWLLLGRLKPGRHRLWSFFFVRFWIVQRAMKMSPWDTFAGTPIVNWYYRLLGSRIAGDCFIHTPLVDGGDLLTIDQSTSVGPGTHVFTHEVVDGWLELGPVILGANCYVGANSVIMPNSSMAGDSTLDDQSLLANGQHLPQGTSWTGSPAKQLSQEVPAVEKLRKSEVQAPSTRRRALVTIGFAAAALALWVLPLAASLPGFGVLLYAYLWGTVPAVFAAAPVAGVSFVLTFSVMIVILKALILPSVQPQIYRLYSMLHLRYWFVSRLMSTHIFLLDAMYATLYLPPFLRLLGVRVGRRAEISTISGITPNLLTIGDESFVADAAHVGPARFYGHSMLLGDTVIGRRTFVGNAAFVPNATALADDGLIGVLSVPPKEEMPCDTSWLGSPAIFLPRRQSSGDFPDSATYRPTLGRLVERYCFEAVRATLPSILYIWSGLLALVAFIAALTYFPVWTVCLLAPLILLVLGILLVTSVVAIKILVIGRYRPLVRPLWTNFVRRTEFVTAQYENVAARVLDSFLGTPFAAWFLRPFGVKIGKRCYLATSYVTEFDVVKIGDDCSIGPHCSLQTHLFEDRVMKMSHVEIGDRVTVGPRSIVLYDSRLEDDTSVDALSLVMKGETLTSETSWRGSPAFPVTK